MANLDEQKARIFHISIVHLFYCTLSCSTNMIWARNYHEITVLACWGSTRKVLIG